MQTVQRTYTTQKLGNTAVVNDRVVSGDVTTPADMQEYSLAKSAQVLWFAGHVIATILGLRFLFLLFGANLRGIVLFIYNISSALVAPYRGIFPAPSAGGSYFDSASLLAILIYYLIIALIIQAIMLFSRSTET